MKTSLFFMGLTLSTCALAQNAPKTFTPVFEPKIHAREVTNYREMLRQAEISESEKAIRQLEKTAEKSTQLLAQDKKLGYIDWMARSADVESINRMARAAGTSYTHSLDSVIRMRLDNMPVSRQTFTYTATGKPSIAVNFVPDELTGKWKNIGHFSFEYDDSDRVLAREVIDQTSPESCQRFEYIYNDETSPVYTQELFYTKDDDGNWVPSQKGEYTYDAALNPLEQKYSFFDLDSQDWVYVERKTATFDEQDRILSYYNYVWDSISGQWVGATNPSGTSQEFVYDDKGRDAETYWLRWEDGDWLRYHRRLDQYNDNNQLIREDIQYWNSDKQDWCGNLNDRNVIWKLTYDDKGRVLTDYTYNVSIDGDISDDSTNDYTYTDREDGSYDVTNVRKLRWKKPTELDLYSMTERSVNKFGSEYYYKNYTYSNTDFAMPTAEEIRTMDENNNYISGDFFNFSLDEEGQPHRYASSKELFVYPEDYVSRPDHMTPNKGIHWKGTGATGNDTDWTLSHEDVFRWEVDPEGKDVLVSAINYKALEDNIMPPVQGYDQEIDYDIDRFKIATFAISNMTDNFYRYALTKYTTLKNWGYYSGDMEWDDDSSTVDTFYYNELTPSSVDCLDAEKKGEIIGYYDLQGRALSAPAKGVNIVKYNNGSFTKVIMK